MHGANFPVQHGNQYDSDRFNTSGYFLLNRQLQRKRHQQTILLLRKRQNVIEITMLKAEIKIKTKIT